MITGLKPRAELELDRFALDSYCKLYLPLWKLDGDSFADHSAYGHLCTNYGSLWTPQGRSFDGVNDYVEMAGTENMINGLKTGTIELWLKTPGRSTKHRGIVGWRNDFNSDFYILHLKDSDKLQMRARTASGDRDLNPSFAGYYGKRTHLVFVRDRTILKAYFNGVEVASRTDMFDEPWNPSSPFHIGQLRMEFYYDGLIAEARFYNFADYIPRILSRSIGG